jgi:L-alanine-DL-glutamate epimerase-like enolase superfamily enzyme
VREAIGSSHTLRVDANMGWATVEEAAANINALAEYGLELVEQPLPRHEYEGLAALRSETGVPIMGTETQNIASFFNMCPTTSFYGVF